LSLVKKLEKAEQSENALKLRGAPHILHPAGGLTDHFVYEPVAVGIYVYKTKTGKKGTVTVDVEFEDEKERRRPHWSIRVEDAKCYFTEKPPKQFLFNMPDTETVHKWVKGEKQSLSTDRLYRLNGLYLRTFLDFPHEFEFSVVQLFIQQSWLIEILPVAFYIGVKGEFGGGKTVTGEAVMLVCRHGYLTGNLSPPFVARSIEKQKLTLMVDELDSITGTRDSDLNGIFRQGYRRGVKYSRVNPDTLETECYDIFGPKLFTVHSEIEEALQTRTVPVHVRETGRPEYPIANLDKVTFARQVYTENFLWYLDNILHFRDNDMHTVNSLTGGSLDLLDTLDPTAQGQDVSAQAKKVRETLFEAKKQLLQEGQVGQVCQVAGRNVELMYMCFVLSNLTKTECDRDIVETFNQKLTEEAERSEVGYAGVLRDVLCRLWNEKNGQPDYMTGDGLVKISNKEVYEEFNMKLKKERGQGVSPATFKGYMLEFGFTDALNRVKLEVPIPDDPEPKARLCNIFTDRVLRKLGVETQSRNMGSLGEKLPEIMQWVSLNKDADGLVDVFALTEHVKSLAEDDPSRIIDILKRDGQLFNVSKVGRLGVK